MTGLGDRRGNVVCFMCVFYVCVCVCVCYGAV